MKNLSPSVCHSDDCKEEESLAKCYGLAVQCHSERLCLEESPTKRDIVWDLSHAFEMTEIPFWGAKHRRISTDKKQEIPHTRPQVSVRNDIEQSPSETLSFWMERSEMKNLLPRVRYCMRSLTFVRDDKWISAWTSKSKRSLTPPVADSRWHRDSSSAYRPRSEWQEATALTLMVDNVGEEKCPPLSGCRERGRRRKAGEDCLSGASSAAPGGERSGRQKKTDNRRATFLGNFFAAGKKLRNAFILRRYNPEESRNRNRNNKICRYFEWRKNKEKVRFFTLDRNDNYSDWDR